MLRRRLTARSVGLVLAGSLALGACGGERGGAAAGSATSSAATTTTVVVQPTTTAAPPPGDNRLVMIGDSMFDRPAQALRKAFAATDYELTLHAVTGSRWADHRDEIAEVARDRPAAVVVELGTNNVLDGHFTDDDRADIDHAVAALADNPCVLFVNAGLVNPNRPDLLSDPAWLGYSYELRARDESNRHLAAAVADHPNFHLFDWDSEFNSHPEWSDDLIHVRPESAEQYAAMIVEQVSAACPPTKA